MQLHLVHYHGFRSPMARFLEFNLLHVCDDEVHDNPLVLVAPFQHLLLPNASSRFYKTI